MDFKEIISKRVSKIKQIDKNRYKNIIDNLIELYTEDPAGNYKYGPAWFSKAYKTFDLIGYKRLDDIEIPLRAFRKNSNEVNYLRKELDKSLSIKNSSKVKTEVLLMYWVLNSIGISYFAKPMEMISDEMASFWQDNFKIGWYMLCPNGYMVEERLGQDYLGLKFIDFMNLTESECYNLAFDNLKNKNIEYKLALTFESVLYAPHLVNSLIENF